MLQDLVVSLVYIGYAVSVLLLFGTVLTWVERKQAAVMADRIGANRAYVRIPFTNVKLVWLGLFHGLADGLKMMLKEDFRPDSYDKLAYALGPWVVFTPVLLVFAVIPFGPTVEVLGKQVSWYITDLNIGVLYVLSISSVGILGIILGGWASNSKYPLLGALRSAAQMVSYEVALGFSIIGVLMLSESLSLVSIVEAQRDGQRPHFGRLGQRDRLGRGGFLVVQVGVRESGACRDDGQGGQRGEPTGVTAGHRVSPRGKVGPFRR